MNLLYKPKWTPTIFQPTPKESHETLMTLKREPFAIPTVFFLEMLKKFYLLLLSINKELVCLKNNW